MGAKNSRARSGRRKGRPEPDFNKEDLVRYIQKSADRGMNLQRILEDFEATPVARKQIKDILNQLVKEGKLARHRGNRYEAAARKLVQVGLSTVPEGVDVVELAAWTAVARVMFNLDETITRD